MIFFGPPCSQAHMNLFSQKYDNGKWFSFIKAFWPEKEKHVILLQETGFRSFGRETKKKKEKRNLYEGTFRIGLFQFKMLTILTSNFSSKTVFLHIYIYIY